MADSTYKLTFVQKPTYLHVIVTGQNSKENVERYVEEILGECVARGTNRVLIEERLEGPRLGMMDVFQIVSQGSSHGRGPLTAIAYVDVIGPSNLMHFAENVAVNRGLPVVIFSTVAEAEKWLLDGDRRAAKPHADADADKPTR